MSQTAIWVDKGIECYSRTRISWLEKMIQKYIKHIMIMKENLLLPKDSLEP